MRLLFWGVELLRRGRRRGLSKKKKRHRSFLVCGRRESQPWSNGPFYTDAGGEAAACEATEGEGGLVGGEKRK